MTTHTIIDSPLGELTLVAEDGALAGVYYADHAHRPGATAFGLRSGRGFELAIEQIGEFLQGDRRSFDLVLAPRGNPFAVRVWELLRRIPYGETRSYGQLAAELGDPRLARAVGTANGRNPLSMIVPCHRVVGAGGALTGYAGGLERKRFLLSLEASVAGNQLVLGAASR
jgi:methylated-DNA-[protein]-cysteine S-methyltransferase